MPYLIIIFEGKGDKRIIVFFGEVGNRFIRVKVENLIGGKLLSQKVFRERGSYGLVIFILVSGFSRPILLGCMPPEIWISNLWLMMLSEGGLLSTKKFSIIFSMVFIMINHFGSGGEEGEG